MTASQPCGRRGGPAVLAVLCLCLILAGAFALRAPVVTYGIPYIYEWDEPTAMDAVVGMLQRSDWSPRTYVYPPFDLYLTLLVAKAHAGYLRAKGLLVSPAAISVTPPDGTQYYWFISHPSFYVWGRTLTLLMGVGCVYLTYRIGALAYGVPTGLLAAAALAVAPGAVFYSGTLRTDMPMAFMVLLAFLAGVRIIQRGHRIDYVLAGVFGGLAFVTKYNGAWILPCLLVAHVLTPYRRRLLNANLGLLVAGSLAGIITGFPELLFRTRSVLADILSRHIFRPGVPLVTLVPYVKYLTVGINWFWFIPPHAGIGLLPMVFAVLGALAGWSRTARVHQLVLSFALPYLAITSTQTYVSPHYMTALVPFVALLAARGVTRGAAWLSERAGASRLRPVLAAVGTVLLLAGPGWESGRLAAALRRPDSRVLATTWLLNHVRAGRTVGIAEDLHWFLPALQGARFNVVTTARNQETPGWLLEHHVDVYVAPLNRIPLPYLPRLAAFRGDPRTAVSPDSPPNLVPIIDPGIAVWDVRAVLSTDQATRFPRWIAPWEMIAEPVAFRGAGVIEGTVRLPKLRAGPGRYTVSMTAPRPSPSWLPPLIVSRYRIQVIAGNRVVGTFLVDPNAPRSYTTAPFAVTGPQFPPIRLVEELRGGVWALRPTRNRCASVPDAPDLNPSQFTIEAWILLHHLHHTSPVNEEHEARVLAKNAELGYALRIEGQRPENTWKLELSLAGRWSVVTGSAGVASTGTEGIVPLERWVHVAATADGRVAQLYIDGTRVRTEFTTNPSGAYTGLIRSVGAPLLIGCRVIYDDWFDGVMTGIRIWNRARPADEIRAGMSAEPPARNPSLVAAWSFDTITADGRVPDISGHGHDIPDVRAADRVFVPLVVSAGGGNASGLPVPPEVIVRRVP